MEFIEKLDKMRIAKPMEPKWIRADSLWNRIAGNMFFSTEEKLKIRLAIETEPGEDVKPIVHAQEVYLMKNHTVPYTTLRE